ncbi:MAG TPA: DUF4232 domain-containing protein [Nocardioides sp.]|nr:DUF4232 domain-containing protein [Nocardioides sp.]
MKILLGAVATAACALALAGCGSDDGDDDTAGPPSSSAASSSAASSSVPPSETTSSVPTEPGECTNQDVSIAYQHEDDATSHSYGFIVVTNTSDQECWVKGYGGTSYVGDDGEQIGAAADRTPGPTPTVALAPGATARSELAETSYGPYTAKECQPTEAVALRVYLPDETDSQLVDHPLTVCANEKIHLLEHKPYTAG